MAEDLALLRSQTLDFITYNPQELVLKRDVMEADGAGGFKVASTTDLTPQTLRVVTQPTSPGVKRMTIDGEEVIPEFVVIGPYDANIQNGDYWLVDAKFRYEIVYVRTDRRYETWAEVAYRG